MSVYNTKANYNISIYEQQDFTNSDIHWALVVEQGNSASEWVDFEDETLAGVLMQFEQWVTA